MNSERPRRFFNGQMVLALALLVAGASLLIIGVPAVTLSWETASEVGTAGFNVFRAPAWEPSPDGLWVKVNVDMIPAEGDEMTGATYTFEDEGVLPGCQYRYQIEEVEWDGNTTRYPEEVLVRAGLPGRWTKVEGVALVAVALFFLWRRLHTL